MSEKEWLIKQFEEVIDEVVTVSPSEWAEGNRIIPESNTSKPGPFRFNVCPPLRPILDLADIRNSVRDIAVMKGAQVCFTVSILENVIGYAMSVLKSVPVMLMTADSELAKLRMESNITPMIQQSNLEHLIRSTDEMNSRKSGKTDKKIEWEGGGYLLPYGAQNANKLRSVSVQYLLQDEVDGYPEKVGKDGDPVKLAEARTQGYDRTRKNFKLSTPLLENTSKIFKAYKEGNQQKCHLPCRKCGEYQELVFQKANKETGEFWGLDWEYEDDKKTLKPGSVRYVCKFCGHRHKNSDKTWMLERFRWVPTAKPSHPEKVSFHYPGLYSPPSMFSWERCVQKWLEAWDVVEDRPKDLKELQVFYNNILGIPFKVYGESIREERVSAHKRGYSFGEIPNEYAIKWCGSPILLLTCAVDVHKDFLAVAVFGWAKQARCFLIDYFRFDGDATDINDQCWDEVRDLLLNKEYIADNGYRYIIQLTLVDSGYLTDTVYDFCSEYDGVIPFKGKDKPAKGGKVDEFKQSTTETGQIFFNITVDLYKDRWSTSLKRVWTEDKDKLQPSRHFNAPANITKKQLKELSVEHKVEVKDENTGRSYGYRWHCSKGVRNELWDLLIYNNAALEMLALEYSRIDLESDVILWNDFYENCEKFNLYFEK